LTFPLLSEAASQSHGQSLELCIFPILATIIQVWSSPVEE
jgi:hypothetical protein